MGSSKPLVDQLRWGLQRREDHLHRKGWDNTPPGLFYLRHQPRGGLEWTPLPLGDAMDIAVEQHVSPGTVIHHLVKMAVEAGSVDQAHEMADAQGNPIVAAAWQGESWGMSRSAEEAFAPRDRLIEEMHGAMECRILMAVTRTGDMIQHIRLRGAAPETVVIPAGSQDMSGVLMPAALAMLVKAPWQHLTAGDDDA